MKSYLGGVRARIETQAFFNAHFGSAADPPILFLSAVSILVI